MAHVIESYLDAKQTIGLHGEWAIRTFASTSLKDMRRHLPRRGQKHPSANVFVTKRRIDRVRSTRNMIFVDVLYA